MNHDIKSFMCRNEHLTGDDEIDRLHEEFYELLSALKAATPEQAAGRLMALITHTRDHFGHEDAIMSSRGYPIRACHIQEHAEVLASLVDVHQRVCTDDHRALPRLIQSLEDWFPGHVQHLDSALTQWIAMQRHQAQVVVLRRNASRKDDVLSG